MLTRRAGTGCCVKSDTNCELWRLAARRKLIGPARQTPTEWQGFIEHDLSTPVPDQQPGRRVAGRVHRPHPGRRQPRPRRYRCHVPPVPGTPLRT